MTRKRILIPEEEALCRKVPDNLLHSEDRLQVEPLLLDRHPGSYGVLDPGQLSLPAQHLLLEGLEVGRAPHGLGLHQVLVKVGLDRLHGAQDLVESGSGLSSRQ